MKLIRRVPPFRDQNRARNFPAWINYDKTSHLSHRLKFLQHRFNVIEKRLEVLGLVHPILSDVSEGAKY